CQQRPRLPHFEQRVIIQIRNGLPVVFRQRRLGIPEINLTGTAVVEYEDARLGLHCEVRLLRTQRRTGCVSCRVIRPGKETVARQQIGKRSADESAAHLPEEFAAGASTRGESGNVYVLFVHLQLSSSDHVGWVESSRPTDPTGGSRRLDPPYALS